MRPGVKDIKLITDKLKQTQQKQTCIHNKIYYNLKWTQKN